MEGDSKTEEPFLKIETIWSETEENFDSITVKEENISDVEPENLQDQPEENHNYSLGNNLGDNISYENDSGIGKDNNEDNTKIIKKEGDKKKTRVEDINTVCHHDAKNFKIVKKRLRCCDCKSILCPECYCTITSSLQTHFSKSDNYNKSWYHCKLCSMIFKSNCALQAHIRIHLLDTPYVCPDCGAIYNNIYFLSLHLINKCYHVYKVIANGCKFCVSQNMAPEDYLSHIEQSHIKPVFKCSLCGLMFESTGDINRHLGASHKNKSGVSLSYFRCSMCGDLIISKHLYAKHIKYHQVHSSSFQIGYLCSCGHSFKSASSFRTHFKDCSKKGILPPQWTYLQVTLKTQEMLQVQNAIQKSNILQSTESTLKCNPLEGSSEISYDKGKMDYSLFEDGDSSEDLDELHNEENSANKSNTSEICKTKTSEESRGKRGEVNNSRSGKIATTSKANAINSDNNDESEKNKANGFGQKEDLPDVQVLKSGLNVRRKSNENVENKSSSIQCYQEDAIGQIVETSVENVEMMTETLGLVPNVQLVEELTLDSAKEDSNKGSVDRSKESAEGPVRGGVKSMKILYDHIPCDHLGYLKIQQCSDLQDRNVRKDRVDSVSNCELGESALVSSTDNYLITSVLDEKTGLMRTKKVLIQKAQVEPSDGEVASAGGADNLDSSQVFTNIHCREINKKRSSTFFSCPFCSVLFPKHFSSFQRFRLHLECYHPEAALDITVDRTQTPKSQTQFTSITVSDEFESDDSYDLDDVDLQTRLNNSLKESNKDEMVNKSIARSELPSNGTSSEKRKRGMCLMDSQMNRSGKRDFDARQRCGRSAEDEEPENVQSKSDKSGSKLWATCKKNSLNKKINEECRSAIRSSNLGESTNGRSNEDNGGSESRETGKNVPQKDRTTYARTFRSNSIEDLDENSESMDSEIGVKYSGAFGSKNDEEDEVILTVERNMSVDKNDGGLNQRTNAMHNKNRSISDESLSNDRSNFRDGISNCHEDKVMQMTLRTGQDSPDPKTCRLRTLGDRGSDNSKLNPEEFGASESQDTDFERSDSQTIKEEGSVRGRSVERRNSRRESDVWSEFYKTLKIAETFKKTKVKNQEKDKEGSEESSILTNYTNKRVVKKPKRYRESSDSDESIEDEKNFGGESRNFDSLMDVDDDDLYIKKKKLLNSLENVDYRILDYVFKLIERKQKNYGFLKKSSEANVRSCRKKVVNGVRGPGKQQKSSLENDEDAVDYSNSAFEKDVFDVNGDEIDWDGQMGSSADDKGLDKRRGRPRKGEPQTVKERRRSDFDREVNFIEKNFETDEGDFFTSKRKRKLSSKLQYYKKMSSPVEKNDFSSGLVISTKTFDAEKKLTCAVCKESYQSEPEFREHIQVHRLDDNSHQCMECGECFVVRPSLEKHLHAFHKIKDVQKYIEENECSITEKTEEVEEPLKENQCKVCKDQFESAHDLNKHFRIHGMAFLRQVKKDTKPN